MKKGDFAKGASVLVLGTAGGQALVILSSPILTRLYSVEQFGIFGVYVAVVSLLGLIASGRYELAIPLPDSETRAKNVAMLSVVAAIGVSLLCLICIVSFGDQIALRLNVPVLLDLVWLIPVSVLTIAIHKVFMYWSIRRKDLKSVSVARLSQGAAAATTQISLGLMHLTGLGLVLGHLAGFATGLVVMLKNSWPSWKGQPIDSLIGDIGSVASRYRRFPLFSIWSDFANVLGTQLPIILFAALFSPSIAGLYMLAHRVANAPTAMVAEAIGKAYMASAVSVSRNSTLAPLAGETFRLLMQIGVLPVAIIATVAPALFAFLFGPEWREAGHYLRLISPWIAMVFVFAPQTVLFAVLEKQQFEFGFQATLLVVRLVALAAGAALGGPELSIGLFAVGSAMVYLGFGIVLLHLAGVSYAAIFRTVVTELGVVAALIAVLSFMVWNIESELVSIAIAAAFGLLAMLRIKPALRRLAAHG